LDDVLSDLDRRADDAQDELALRARALELARKAVTLEDPEWVKESPAVSWDETTAKMTEVLTVVEQAMAEVAADDDAPAVARAPTAKQRKPSNAGAASGARRTGKPKRGGRRPGR
jgi:hypothetical protein